jgi:hypothetical protein
MLFPRDWRVHHPTGAQRSGLLGLGSWKKAAVVKVNKIQQVLRRELEEMAQQLTANVAVLRMFSIHASMFIRSNDTVEASWHVLLESSEIGRM